MRLINTTTYKLEDHVNPESYAILSHTWQDNEEVLYADFKAERGKRKKGYKKIKYLCTQAHTDGLKYAWIDTVCIDKSSSAELSEAINSMFRWYGNAEKCYVYLDDTDDVAGIEKCRWLTRGWTLQELLAPYEVCFFNRDWVSLGTKASLLPQLVRWTGIDQIALEEPSKIWYTSAATRMSWAAFRSTTRIEDTAYCLLGIFNLYLPLIYGEGEEAFRRLQEEIVRKHADLSILAFKQDRFWDNIFAQSPAAFGSGYKVLNEKFPPHDCELTSRGLKLDLKLVHDRLYHYWAILPCRFEFNLTGSIAIGLQVQSEKVSNTGPDPRRSVVRGAERICVIPNDKAQQLTKQSILLLNEDTVGNENIMHYENSRHVCCLKADSMISHGFEVVYAEPDCGIGSWDSSSLVSEILSNEGVIIRKFGFVHHSHREAFIIMFTVICWDYYGNTEAFISVKAKPPDVECTMWLEQEGMYSITKEPKNFSSMLYNARQSTVMIDGELWERVLDEDSALIERPYQRLQLLSNSCFSEVKLKIEASNWTIVVEPSTHADHERKLVAGDALKSLSKKRRRESV